MEVRWTVIFTLRLREEPELKKNAKIRRDMRTEKRKCVKRKKGNIQGKNNSNKKDKNKGKKVDAVVENQLTLIYSERGKKLFRRQ
jgi:uncharacterized membrane protein